MIRLNTPNENNMFQPGLDERPAGSTGGVVAIVIIILIIVVGGVYFLVRRELDTPTPPPAEPAFNESFFVTPAGPEAETPSSTDELIGP